jgi:hypothetical protein
MTMAPMQQTSGALTSQRPPGTEISNRAARAPSALDVADGVVRARIMAAVAGIAAPLSVTSAPCSAPYQTTVEAEPETSSTHPHHRELPALPHYPPLGRYGDRLERVEAVSRFVGACGGCNDIETTNFEYGEAPAPEPDSLLDATEQPAEPDPDLAVIDIDARDDGDIYHPLVSWLRTHKQDTALHELTQLRRVLVLIPTDKLGQSWQAYLMCPASAANATAMCAPGTQGRSWPLRAQGTFACTELAERWQHWRMHQHLCAEGVWQLDQSSEGPRAPAWCGDSAPQLQPPVSNAIPLHLTEPQRLRRLLGTQWTVLMLLAPEPFPLALRR